MTNGVFDILHRGHVAYLEAARALGASLVVAVNSTRRSSAWARATTAAQPLETGMAGGGRASLRGRSSCRSTDDTPRDLIVEVMPGHPGQGRRLHGADHGRRRRSHRQRRPVVAIPFEHERSTTALVEEDPQGSLAIISSMEHQREVDARGLNCPLPILRTKRC
jgi:cytidyltransferase-like protein